MSMNVKSKPIQISQILTDRGTQMRAEVNESVVCDYVAMLEVNKAWPFDAPLVVFWDGKKYYLADGFHRYFAAKRCKRTSVPCEVINGTVRDAIKYALSANARHGLRRTNEDKRTSVECCLADKEWKLLSSRLIAEMCGVSHTFVDKVREGLLATVASSENKNTAKDDVSEKRVAKNGAERSSTQPEKTKPSTEAATPTAGKKKKASESKPKAPETPKQRAAMMIKSITDHNAAMMRLIDDLQELSPNKRDHQRVVQMFRAIHDIMKAWK